MGQLVVIGDVGGTNCRLALADLAAPDAAPREVRRYSTDDFANPADAIRAFLKEAGASQIEGVSIAVAGPTGEDEIQLTNAGWRFSKRETANSLGVPHFVVSNDLEAVGYAILALGPDKLDLIGDAPRPETFGPTAIVAPGTGLGVALALPGSLQHVLATEGGHVGFSPSDDVEFELLRYWRPHIGRVTNEHVISGPGLVRLYRALAAMEDRHADPIAGPEIMTRALAGEDALCVEAVDRFAKILGAVAGDATITQGATAAVMTGGIVADLKPFLEHGGFRARFEQRGPGVGHLRHTPTLIAARTDLGLLGAAAKIARL